MAKHRAPAPTKELHDFTPDELRSLAYSILQISDGKVESDTVSTSLPVRVTKTGRRFNVGLVRS